MNKKWKRKETGKVIKNEKGKGQKRGLGKWKTLGKENKTESERDCERN